MNETSARGTAAGSPPPPPPGRPPLRRPREGRLIAGVAAGVAEHVGMDVAIVRILFVVATIFSSGFGVAAYAVAWILIPEPSEQDPAGEPAPRRELGGRDPLFWVGIGLLVLGAVWLLDRPGFGPFAVWLRPDRGLLVPLVLIAFGVALWRASDVRHRSAPNLPAVPPRPGSATAPAAWQPATGTTTTDRAPQETDVNDDTARPPDQEADRDTAVLPRPGDPSTPPPGSSPPPGSDPTVPPPGSTPPPTTWDEPAWSPPPVPDRESAVLVRSTLGLALVTAGVLWLLRVADVLTLGTGRILAAALLVVGLGLLVGTFVGRGRGLIGVGIVLLPIVVIAELLHPMSFELAEYRQGVGEHVATPATVDDLEPSYQLGAGTLTVDLTDVEVTGQRRVSVQVGFGEAVVLVPDDVTVEITARAAGGELNLLGETSTGMGVERTVTDEVDGASGQLLLDVQVGFGEVSVQRALTSDTSDR